MFAGCLNITGEGAGRLREQRSDRLIVLDMDVTNQQQLNETVQQIKELLPQGGKFIARVTCITVPTKYNDKRRDVIIALPSEILWGLVNNAGIMARGYVEWVPLHTYRRMIDVNVLGVIAATKAFLPLLRRARGDVFMGVFSSAVILHGFNKKKLPIMMYLYFL